MSEPRKHHYIPAFYLRQWARPDGFLCEMRKIRDKLIVSKKTPESTGFQKDLYKIEGVSAEFSQHFERTFMHMVDTQAAAAMRKIPNAPSPFTVKERDAWVRFMLSLLFRNPEAVTAVGQHIKQLWAEALESLRRDYEANKHPDFPATFDEFLAKTDPNAGAIAASNFLQTIMNLEGVANTILGMKWGRIHFFKSRFSLLTSDRPLDMPFGLQSQRSYIALPISPRVVFTACYDDSALRSMQQGDHSDTVRRLNHATVEKARQYVWGIDDSAEAFVRKHICTVPDRVIISEEARELSLQQARGK
jgi:hypothetical protein